MLRLHLNRFDHLRMAVTGCINGNTGRKIKKDVTVDIMNPEPFGVVDNERINSRVRRGDIGFVKLDQFFSLGPGSEVLICGDFIEVPFSIQALDGFYHN